MADSKGSRDNFMGIVSNVTEKKGILSFLTFFFNS